MPDNEERAIVTRLTDAMRDLLISKTSKALPNNPSERGYTASQIKDKMGYEACLYLFDTMRTAINEITDWLEGFLDGDAIAKKAEQDKNGNDIAETYETKSDATAKDISCVHLAGDEAITGKKTFTDNVKLGTSGSDNSKTFDVYYTINLRGPVTSAPIMPGNAGFSIGASDNRWNTAYVQYLDVSQTIKQGSYAFSLPSKSGTFALVSDVESYHRFRTDASGYIYQIFADGEDEENSDNRVMNHNDGVAIANEVQQLKDALVAMLGIKSDEKVSIEKIIAGLIAVGNAHVAQRAYTDIEGHAINVAQYGSTFSLDYEQSTGKLTVKLYNKLGTQIDSKVIDLPSELVFTNQYYDSANKKLVFVPASGGSNIEISLSDLVDTYTAGTDSEGIAVVTINDHVIKVSIADGSISMSKLSSTLQSTWNGWVSAEADRVLAEQGRASAEAQRVLNENARLAMPHLDIDNQGYLIINYGSSRDITID